MHREESSSIGEHARQFPEHETDSTSLIVERSIVFVVAAGLLTFLALDGAGYDIEVRQGVGLGVWAVIALGFAVGILPRSQPSRILLIPACGVVLLIAWMMISLSWTSSAERTMAEVARVLLYAGFVVLAVYGLNRRTFRAAAGGLSVAALGIVALSVATRIYPSLIPSAAGLGEGFHPDRLSYPLDYWNAVGIWGAMGIAIGLVWSAQARLAIIRALALAAVPVAGLAVYLSYSRGAVIGTAVAAVAVLVLTHNRWTAALHMAVAGGGAALAISVVRGHEQIAQASGGDGGDAVLLALEVAALACIAIVLLTFFFDSDRVRLPREIANWTVPAFVALVLIVGFVAGQGSASDAIHEFSHQEQPSSGADPATRLTSGGGSRTHLWDAALDAFDAHPIEGIGPGTYEYWWTQHGDVGEFVRDAHSLYLEQLAELGIPGLALLLVCMGGLLAVALLSRRRLEEDGDLGASAALVAAALVFAVTAGGDWMWEETAVTVLALIGLATAAAGGSKPSARGEARSPRVAVRVVIVVLALAAAAFEVPGLVATQRVRASEQAVRDGDLRGAKELANDAVSAEPWAATPHLQLGIVLGRQGHYMAARRNVLTAQSKEPTNWRIPLVLAPIEKRLGHPVKVRRAYRRARHLWPDSPFNRPPRD